MVSVKAKRVFQMRVLWFGSLVWICVGGELIHRGVGFSAAGFLVWLELLLIGE